MTPERRQEIARRSLETRLANALARIHSRADEIVERCPMTWFRRADAELTSYPGMTVQQVRRQVELELLTLASGSWESRAENRRWP